MPDKNEILERIAARVLLLDGGLGTLLFAMGLEQGRAPEWWNLEHGDRITEAHRRYVEAGSDLIHTNTFGGSPTKLHSAGLADRCREVNAAAVELARRACGPQTLVAGDVGPTGQMLPPMGDATEAGLAAAFEEQTSALAEAGADVIAIETMYDLREAKAALGAAKKTGLPVFTSMTFEAKKRGFFTIVGDRIAPALTQLVEAGADVVGFNCSVEAQVMRQMVGEAAAAVDAPIVAQPNAGQPRATAEGVVYDADPLSFARELTEIVAAGARLVGGCCGTDPEFIRQARTAIDVLQRA